MQIRRFEAVAIAVLGDGGGARRALQRGQDGGHRTRPEALARGDLGPRRTAPAKGEVADGDDFGVAPFWSTSVSWTASGAWYTTSKATRWRRARWRQACPTPTPRRPSCRP